MTLRLGLRRLALCMAVLALFGTGSVQAQGTGSVQGVAVDAMTNRPIPGVRVSIQGTTAAQITNEQGRFAIMNAPVGKQTLRFEVLGYHTATREITVNAGQATTANITIEPTAFQMAELVVTGISGGAVERAKVPFSVSRVDAADMPVPSANVLSSLSGKVPGTTISAHTGRPGANQSVMLRAPTSINAQGRSHEPLFIVDGIVLNSGGLADINQADIQSIEIVKGAAASTLYGSRAANGVIQITTKRGSLDGVRFTARSEYGLNDIEGNFAIARNHPFLLDETGTRFCVLDVFGSNETCARTIDYRTEQLRINNTTGDFSLTPPAFPVDPGSGLTGDQTRRVFLAGNYPGRTYDAVKQLVDPKPIAINDFSMAGRINQTTFYASLGHVRQGGAIMGLRGYERLSTRVNLGQRINDQWNIELTSYISRTDQDGSNQEEAQGGFFRLTRSPAIVDITARDDFGRLMIRPNLAGGGVQNENALYSFMTTQRGDLRWRYALGGSVRYSPIDWIDADATFSVDRENHNFRQFNDKGYRTTGAAPATNNGLVFNGVSNVQSINTGAGIVVRRSLMDDVASRFTARWLYEQQDGDTRSFQGNQLGVGGIESGANATNLQNIASTRTRTQQMALTAGAFFDVKDRYTFDFALRRDGNSRFGADSRWQTYWRGSGAWLMARESWFPSEQLSTFTLRGSYGTAGNVPSATAQHEAYNIGAGGVFTPQTLGNALLRPEVVTEREFGVDVEVARRWGLSVTYAEADSRDQILPVPIPVSTGFPVQWKNAGELSSKTWEGALTLPIIQSRNGFSWTARANYTRNRSMITELYTEPFFIGTNNQAQGDIIRIEKGIRYGSLYGRVFMTRCEQLPAAFQSQCGGPTSAFQKNDEGWLVWVGEGNNPRQGITHNLYNAVLPAASGPYGVQAAWGMPILVRDENSAEPIRAKVGDALPDFQVGMGHTIQYRNFSLYGLFEGSFGRDVWNQGRHWSYLDFLGGELDQGGKTVETAKPIGYYYRGGPGPGGPGTGIGGFYDALTASNYMVEDASYIKLRELSVSYNIGKVAGLGTWSASVIGRNLKTWTDYKGFDPEVGVSGGVANSGLLNAFDYFTFPALRTFSLVLSTTF